MQYTGHLLQGKIAIFELLGLKCPLKNGLSVKQTPIKKSIKTSFPKNNYKLLYFWLQWFNSSLLYNSCYPAVLNCPQSIHEYTPKYTTNLLITLIYGNHFQLRPHNGLENWLFKNVGYRDKVVCIIPYSLERWP